MEHYIIPLGLVVMMAIVAVDTYRRNRRIKKAVQNAWGKVPPRQRWDSLDSVSAYWDEKCNTYSNALQIDGITWDDLDMDHVFERVNATFSSVGSEYLYARLHEVSFDHAELGDFEALVHTMDSDKELREQLAVCLSRLGKNDFNGVADFIFNPSAKRLANAFIYPVLAALPLLSLGLAFISWQQAIIALAATSGLNMFVYYRSKHQLEKELEAITYITSIVVAAAKARKLSAKTLPQVSDRLASLLKPLKSVAGFGSSVLARPRTEMEFILEYIKIVIMYDFLNYSRIIGTLCKYKEEFHHLWQEIGRLDSALAIASYRNTLHSHTAPVFVTERAVQATGIYHPLVDNAITNDLDLCKNVIITGSNASGKSTYVKAVAINAIMAQTIHTCLAEKFSLTSSKVLSSMAVRDNVVAGDSYFVAEIKSLQRIIDSVGHETPILCFIDEILKGTNTVERIAASSAILTWLAQENCLCMVASHDIELTELQADLYDNLHFREHITENGIEFDYKVKPGRTTTRNAIKLLEHLGYPDKITVAANELASGFDSTRKWVRQE